MASSAHASFTLSRYLARRFFSGFLIILLSFGAIIFLIDVVELMRRAASRPDVNFLLILQLGLLKLPYALQRIVPFAVLFGGMYAFWRMTRTSELVVVRAAGVSVWQFLMPAVVTAVMIGTILVTVINPLGSSLLLRYEQMDAELFQGRSSLLTVSEGGLWLRQADTDGQSVIHAVRMTPDNMSLTGVTVFLFDSEHKFARRLDSDRARLEPGYWRLRDVIITAPDETSRQVEEYRLPTDWTPAKIQDSFSSPETLSFWNLPGFIKLLDQAGFTATRHRVYWYSLLAVPAMLGAMVLIAASFSLRMSRRGGVSTMIATGVLFSFFIFFLSDVVFALGLSASIPAALAAGTPAAVTGLIGLSILLHTEEG